MSIQIPPAVGTSGQIVEAVVVVTGSTEHRHVMALGAADSTAYGPLTSSGGVLVAISNATTAATNPWSSAPGFNVPMVSASSGFMQISGTAVIVSASSGLVQLTSAPLVIMASSGYIIRSISSGIVSPSSVWSVLSSVTTVSSGTISTLSSGAILLSSAGLTQAFLAGTSGGFGLVTSAGSLQVITTASASGSTSINIVGSSNAQAPVTSSGGLSVTIVGGAGAGSTVVHISGTSGGLATVTTSGGMMTMISNTAAPVTSSAGVYVNLVTTAGGGYLVTTSGGLAVSHGVQTAAGYGPVTSSYGMLAQPSWSQSSSRLIVGTSVGKISSAPGVLTYLNAFSTSTPGVNVAWLRLYDQTTGNATSANNAGLAGACFLFKIQSSVTGIPEASILSVPQGIKFATACSFDIVIAATSTAAQVAGWVTAQYTS